MNGMPDHHDLARQLAVLEERMNTMYADYTAAHERLRADLAKRDAERGAEAAKRDAEAAKRDAERNAEAAKRDVEAAKRDAEFAKRETRFLLAVGGMIALAVAIIKLPLF